VVEDAGALLFTRQPRFGARASVIEVVKGGRDEGESALQCAQRELREELGVSARTWTELGALYEIPSIVSEPVTLFWASDIAIESQELEHVESIDLVRLSIDGAFEAAIGGEIDDAITVAALFRYFVYRGLIVSERR
jgi:ADP-ribose pyrophosphatase